MTRRFTEETLFPLATMWFDWDDRPQELKVGFIFDPNHFDNRLRLYVFEASGDGGCTFCCDFDYGDAKHFRDCFNANKENMVQLLVDANHSREAHIFHNMLMHVVTELNLQPIEEGQ